MVHLRFGVKDIRQVRTGEDSNERVLADGVSLVSEDGDDDE